MPWEITIFPRIFQIRFTVRISSYSTNSMSVSVTRCDSHTESEKFLLEISFMYPENYNDRAWGFTLVRSSNLRLLQILWPTNIRPGHFWNTNIFQYSFALQSKWRAGAWPTGTTPPRVRETSGNVMQSAIHRGWSGWVIFWPLSIRQI